MSQNNIQVLSADPIDPATLVVVGRDQELHLGPWAVACPLEMDYQGTTTITVSLAEQEPGDLAKQTAGFFARDPKTGIRRLAKWNTLQVFGTTYVLREFNRTRAGRDLVFYDEASEDFKRYQGPLKISRGRATRAQFVRGLCTEAGVKALIVDQNVRQPIADLAPADLKALHQTNQSPGVKKQLATRQAKNAGLKALRDAKLGLENIQLHAIADSLTVADDLQVNNKVRLALVVAGLGESGFDPRKTDYATHTHKGVFQSNQIPQYDTQTQARHFLQGGRSFLAGGAIGLEKAAPKMTVGQIAAAVEVSNGSGGYYDGFKARALKILNAWSPGTDASSSAFDQRTGAVDRAEIEEYDFTIADGENFWDGTERLANQVLWRRYAIFNYLVYGSDFRLAQADPYQVSLDDDWIDDPGPWTATSNQRIDQLPITGRLNAVIPPGTAIAIKDDDPNYGTWLVRNFKRDLMDPASNIAVTLGRPIAPLPEPASTVKVISGRDPSSAGVDTSAIGLRKAIIQAAEKTLTSKTGYRHYWQGGKLTADPTPPQNNGYRSDCSQWTRAIYLQATGVDIGTNTWAQDAKGTTTHSPLPGDLLMMNDHVEIYLGEGRTIGHGTPTIDYAHVSDFADRHPHFVTFGFLNTA